MLDAIGAGNFIDTLPLIKKAVEEGKIQFPRALLSTKGGGDSFSQTSLYSACIGTIHLEPTKPIGMWRI